MTSDERREVAARLREHDGNAYADVADMCDEDLADLIDPTCRVESVEPIEYGEFNETIGYFFRLTCGHGVVRPREDMPPAYCDECGATRLFC